MVTPFTFLVGLKMYQKKLSLFFSNNNSEAFFTKKMTYIIFSSILVKVSLLNSIRSIDITTANISCSLNLWKLTDSHWVIMLKVVCWQYPDWSVPMTFMTRMISRISLVLNICHTSQALKLTSLKTTSRDVERCGKVPKTEKVFS